MAQESIFGSKLWNGNVLRLEISDESRLAEYADDIALVAAASTVELTTYWEYDVGSQQIGNAEEKILPNSREN